MDGHPEGSENEIECKTCVKVNDAMAMTTSRAIIVEGRRDSDSTSSLRQDKPGGSHPVSWSGGYGRIFGMESNERSEGQFNAGKGHEAVQGLKEQKRILELAETEGRHCSEG